MSGLCQPFNLHTELSYLTIEGKNRKGHRIYFDFPAKQVKKGWWKYTRKFARPLNMKSYYKVTIPGTENTGNVDLILLSKTIAKPKGSVFFLTIDDKVLKEDRKKSYLEQVQQMLVDFKRSFYIDDLNKKIYKLKKKARKQSKALEKGKLRIEAFIKTEKQLDRLQEELKGIYLAPAQ